MTLLRSVPWLRAVPTVALAVAVGCATDIPGFANRFTTPAERAFPRSYLQLLVDGRLDSAFSLLTPDLRTDTTRRIMRQVAALLRDAKLDSMRLVGVNTASFGAGTHDVNLTYEMPTTAGSRWVTSNVATRHAGPNVSVIGFSAYPLNGPLEVINRFTLSGKTATHYILLTLALLMPIVTITVAVFVARARGMPRRWLWVFASLIATPVLSINWTTGDVSFNNGWFLLFGGAATAASLAAPWIVSFGLPTGAGIAYLKVRRWRQGTHPTSTTDSGEVAA